MAQLVAGELKPKVSGRDVTAVGQQAIDALDNNTFKNVGVVLRDDRLLWSVARAATRLIALSGDVMPLESEISKAAVLAKGPTQNGCLLNGSNS